MVPKTFIDVPPARASKARALGAVWDPDARSYFVPAGADLAVFTDWLPRESTASSSELSVAPVRETALAVPSKGIPLSQLLNGVASAVATAFKAGVWTTVEVANVNVIVRPLPERLNLFS